MLFVAAIRLTLLNPDLKGSLGEPAFIFGLGFHLLAAFDLKVFQLLVFDLDVDAFIDLVALDDAGAFNLIPGIGIDFLVADAVAGLAVELVEGDAFAAGRGRIERNGAGDEGQLEIALPIWPAPYANSTLLNYNSVDRRELPHDRFGVQLQPRCDGPPEYRPHRQFRESD
jgi:hypothetical protein